jgi:hypothetical protein
MTKIHDRIDLDAYSTPLPLADWIVRRAVAILGRPVDVPCPPLLFEPGCGEAAPFIVAARRLGLVARGSDLRPIALPVDLAADTLVGFECGVDYIAPDRPGFKYRPDIITMNPPFKEALPFVERALTDVSPTGVVAALVRVAFLAGIRRRQLFQAWPPVETWVCVRRPSFAHGGTDPAQEYAAIFWIGATLHRTLVALGRAELRTGWIDPNAADATNARKDPT